MDEGCCAWRPPNYSSDQSLDCALTNRYKQSHSTHTYVFIDTLNSQSKSARGNCIGVISPSFIFTLDHTLAFRAWIILFTPVDSGKSSDKGNRNGVSENTTISKTWTQKYIQYINVCSVVVSSAVCQTHHPHLAIPVDWVLPAQRHEPNTTVVLHVCWPLENIKYQTPYSTLLKIWFLCVLLSYRTGELTVFTDSFTHQNEHLWRKIFHHGYPRM